jgi:beta-glucanase (GH16 family)
MKNIYCLGLLLAMLAASFTRLHAQAGDTYYFMPASGDANVLSNWNTKPDGTGTAPVSLYYTNRFYIINNGKSATLSGSFGAAGVHIYVGDETGGSLIAGTAGTLTTVAGNVFLRAMVNVNSNSVLNYRMTPLASFYPVLTFCDSSGTVNYNGTAAQNVLAANYGKLTINNSAGVTLPGNIRVSGSLTTIAGTINTTTNNAAITFNGSLVQTIPGNSVFTGGAVHQVSINNNAGVKLTDGATLTVLDSLIVSSGTLTLGTGSNLTVKGKSYIPASPLPDSSYKPGYTLVWHDEFDGPANTAPNPEYWVHHYTATTPHTVTTWGYTLSTMSLASYSLLDGNGHLRIKAHDSSGVYYSGDIATAWPYNVFKQYGYMECKMTFTPNNGVNCAFWMQSPTISNNPAANDPATYGTEIDICEYIGPAATAPRGHVNTTIHKNGYDTTYHQSVSNATPVNNTGYHIVAVEWTPAYYKFYTDGVLKWTLTDPAFISKRPEFVLLSTGFGWSPPNIAGNTWPVYMNVDYVRLYNKN